MVQDSAGNKNNQHQISFKTEDIIIPQIISLSPDNGLRNIAVNSDLIITFSEAVQAHDRRPRA